RLVPLRSCHRVDGRPSLDCLRLRRGGRPRSNRLPPVEHSRWPGGGPHPHHDAELFRVRPPFTGRRHDDGIHDLGPLLSAPLPARRVAETTSRLLCVYRGRNVEQGAAGAGRARGNGRGDLARGRPTGVAEAAAGSGSPHARGPRAALGGPVSGRSAACLRPRGARRRVRTVVPWATWPRVPDRPPPFRTLVLSPLDSVPPCCGRLVAAERS